MLKDNWCEMIERAEFARGGMSDLGFSKLSVGISPTDSTILLCLKRSRGCQHIWFTEAEARSFLQGYETYDLVRKDIYDAEKSDDAKAKEREANDAAERKKARDLTEKLLSEIKNDRAPKAKYSRRGRRAKKSRGSE